MWRRIRLHVNAQSSSIQYATVEDPMGPRDWAPLHETIVEQEVKFPSPEDVGYDGASLRICVTKDEQNNLELSGSNWGSHKTFVYGSKTSLGGAFLLINKPERKLVLYGESESLGRLNEEGQKTAFIFFERLRQEHFPMYSFESR